MNKSKNNKQVMLTKSILNLHESNPEEKEIVCLEPQIFLLHSMFDTEDVNIDNVIQITENRQKHLENIEMLTWEISQNTKNLIKDATFINYNISVRVISKIINKNRFMVCVSPHGLRTHQSHASRKGVERLGFWYFTILVLST